MQPLINLFVILVAISLTSAAPRAFTRRIRRDVTDLLPPPDTSYLPPDTNYLPPESADMSELIATNEAPEALEDEPVIATEMEEELLPQDTTVLGDDGYVYKLVRQLRLRQRNRRDVSHLNLEYLPPTMYLQPASLEYLPPAMYLQPAALEYLPPVPQVEEVQINLEYLPPVMEEAAVKNKENEQLVVTEVPTIQTKPPVTQAQAAAAQTELPEAQTELPEAQTEVPVEQTEYTASQTEAPAVRTETAVTPTQPTAAQNLAPAIQTEVPQDTAVLLADGYHYKQPAEIVDLVSALVNELPEVSEASVVPAVPDESNHTSHSAAPVTSEYLPPLEPDVVVADGPAEESAALTDDGYHYRVIRRLRF